MKLKIVPITAITEKDIDKIANASQQNYDTSICGHVCVCNCNVAVIPPIAHDGII